MPDPISHDRRQTVDAARGTWVRRLVDTSRRNNLLYFRELRVGTLDLSKAKEGALDELLMGAKVPLRNLVPDDPKAASRLEALVRKARSNREERGLETLYLAYGMATWPVDDGGRLPEAAAVLVPLAVEGRTTPMLFRSGPPRANLALLHVLAEMGIEPDLDEESEDAVAMLGRLQATVPLEGFRVSPRAVVGNFSFQKLAMVRDLQDESLADHDLVAALAGDPSARAIVTERRVVVDPRSLDAIPPHEEFMPLDADSSQQAVVHAVARGSDGVVQGPPGCGKSQTIANLIATLVADGKRVLFVAEKRAALEAVHKRLEATNLDHLALDLHGATVSQKAVVARLGETLATIRASPNPQDDDLNRRFTDRRMELAEHDRLMHAPLAPSGLSPFALGSALLASKVETKTRWRGAELAAIADPERIESLLAEAETHRDLFLGRGPWANAKLDDGPAVQAALDQTATVAESAPKVRLAVSALASDLGIESPATVKDVRLLVNLLEATNHVLVRFDPAIFAEATALHDALRPMVEGTFAKWSATLFNGAFRKAHARFRALSRVANLSLTDVEQAARVAGAWQARGASPRGVDWQARLGSSWSVLNDSIAVLNRLLPALELESRPNPEIVASDLLAEAATARAVPRVRAIEAELNTLGAVQIVEEIRSEPLPLGRGRGGVENGSDPFTTHHSPSTTPWPPFFRDAYLRSCHDAALTDHPALAAFRREGQDALVAEFQKLDRERTTLAAARVRRAHAEWAVAAMNRHPEQTDIVRGETQKRSRHKPLRRLLAEAPDVLTAVCPCWMASPLNVSGLLPAEPIFDVVVFDEASQVLPEDAVGAILRGKRLVVAGDRHQLPPTVFFADGDDGDEEESEVSGYQSLLDQVGAFLEPWPLLWHYRSRDERLIAFSNHFVYGDRLVTFPGLGGEPCVEHVLVEPSPLGEGRVGVQPGLQEESPSAEVDTVVELVLRHAEEHPDQTLGVIAMGLRHATRIEAALDLALDARPDLEPYFDPKRTERFFVKNLESVQGDERDAILISVGYGKDAQGRLPYRFGPLLQDGGERRLNVAVTRARSRMTVVSSFSHLDMDPARSKARGVVLLREFLAYAASGSPLPSGVEGSGVRGPDPFEADVLQALAARGVPLVPRYGLSGYRLDFAARHPTEPDRFVLALGTDGPSAHAAPTVRDRDRLRAQQQEAVGWRVHRLWSAGWTTHREQEIEAAAAAYQGALLPSGEGSPWSEARAEGGTVGEGVNDGEARAEGWLRAPAWKTVGEGESRLTPPPILHRDDIADVPEAELDALVRWVRADGLKTDDEIVDEVSDRLGYARVGAKIARTVQASIERMRD